MALSIPNLVKLDVLRDSKASITKKGLHPVYSKRILPIHYLPIAGLEDASDDDLEGLVGELEYVVTVQNQLTMKQIPLAISGEVDLQKVTDILSRFFERNDFSIGLKRYESC